MTDGWKPGPPPKSNGLFIIISADGRTGKLNAPVLARYVDWMHPNPAIRWHFPIPDPPETETNAT